MYIYLGREIVKWGGEYMNLWKCDWNVGHVDLLDDENSVLVMRCGLLGDGDSALIVISRGLWLIHLCYAWDAKVVWRVPLPRSISAMPWDAKDSMTWPPSPPWCLWIILIMEEGDSVLVYWFKGEVHSVLGLWYVDEVYFSILVDYMWTRYISLF